MTPITRIKSKWKESYRATGLELFLPAVDAVGHLILAVERLVSQLVLAASTDKAFRVPPLIEGVQNGSRGEGFGTFCANSTGHFPVTSTQTDNRQDYSA